jgi:imidazolonepropionase-like amidohydrolase
MSKDPLFPALRHSYFKNGLIASISEPSTEAPDHGLSLDGCFVTPGLIDCHVHLCMDGRADGGVAQDKSMVVLQMLRHAQLAYTLWTKVLWY